MTTTMMATKTTKTKRAKASKSKGSPTPGPAVTMTEAMQIIREEDATERERLDPHQPVEEPAAETVPVDLQPASDARRRLENDEAATLGRQAIFYIRREQRPRPVVARRVAFGMEPAVGGEVIANLRLEVDFFVQAHGFRCEQREIWESLPRGTRSRFRRSLHL